MRIQLTLALAAALVAAPGAIAQAVLIEVVPAAQEVVQGDPVQITLAISGLGDQSPPSLGTFDLDVLFDASVLTFASAAFGDPVLGDQLDLAGLGSVTDVTPGSGVVNLFQLSLDTADDLNALQAGDFTLATLTFTATGPGASPLALAVTALGDAEGVSLATDLASGAVLVTPGQEPVPGPPGAALLGLGLACLLAHHLRRRPDRLRRRGAQLPEGRPASR
ncbi:MAG: hypothetical protein L0027_07750 [Candidatus Rokubacteria bacterium]|nr:hypothetical protein [Candidatus Rokubacteria bacterium]